MKRREFITGSLAAAALAGVANLASAAENGQNMERDYYELRAYRLKSADHELLDNYLEKAAIPAWNRLGIKSVGVFTEMESKDGAAIWVLIPHPSLESFSSAWSRLNADAEYQKTGASYLQTAKEKPGFDRID